METLGDGFDAAPYREHTDEGYAQKVLDTFDIQERRKRIAMSGPCPSCGDIMDFLSGETTLRSGSMGASQAENAPETALKQREQLLMVCMCDASHPGRPAGLVGCGAYWAFTVEQGANA